MSTCKYIGHFEELLEESVKIHGHLCPGQVLGVRMALYGLDKIGIYDPTGKDRQNLYLFAELDRCATDALQSVTGCSLGQRTMKFLNYGKMAATFMNLSTGKAVRVIAKKEAKEKAQEYLPHIRDKYNCQIEAYKVMSDQELFYHETIHVAIPPENLPGRPLPRVRCEACGKYIQDMREVYKDGQILCRPCAYGGRYWVQEFFYLMHSAR